MSFVIGIFNAADRRGGGGDSPGKFSLTQAGLCSQVVDLSRDLSIENFFFVLRTALGDRTQGLSATGSEFEA